MLVTVCITCYMCIIFSLIDWKHVIIFLERTKNKLVFSHSSQSIWNSYYSSYTVSLLNLNIHSFIHSSFFAFTRSFIYPRSLSKSLLSNSKCNVDCEEVNTHPSLSFHTYLPKAQGIRNIESSVTAEYKLCLWPIRITSRTYNNYIQELYSNYLSPASLGHTKT